MTLRGLSATSSFGGGWSYRISCGWFYLSASPRGCDLMYYCLRITCGCLYLSCFTHVQVCQLVYACVKWKCVFWYPNSLRGVSGKNRRIGSRPAIIRNEHGAIKFKCLAQGHIELLKTLGSIMRSYSSQALALPTTASCELQSRHCVLTFSSLAIPLLKHMALIFNQRESILQLKKLHLQ
jgi:hypothetical protein